MNNVQSQTDVSGMGLLPKLQDIEKILNDSQILLEKIWGLMYGNDVQEEKKGVEQRLFIVPTVARIHDRMCVLHRFLVDLKALLDIEKDGKLVSRTHEEA